MEEEKVVDVTGECEQSDAESEESRREFLSKVAAAASAVVAAGLLTGGAAQEAEAQPAPMSVAAKPKALGSAAVASRKTNNGLALTLNNKQVVQSIAKESLGLNQPGAEVMELSLTWK